MVEIKSKLKVRRSAYKIEVGGRLELPFEARQKSGFRAKLDTGEEVGVLMQSGDVLRGGDLVTASDGRVFEIVALPEEVLDIQCRSPRDLARVAYYLGNRHVALEVGEGYLRIAHDHALEGMLSGLGATIRHLKAPFEPEVDSSHGSAEANPQHEHHHGHHHGDDDDHGHGHKH